MEIEMFFAKYDADGDGEFSYEEGQKLVEDLDNDMIDLDAPMVGNLKKTADTRALAGPATINHEEFGMWEANIKLIQFNWSFLTTTFNFTLSA